MKRRHFMSTAAMTSVGAACLGQFPVKAAVAETHEMTISNTESFVVHSDHVGDAFQISAAFPTVLQSKPLTKRPPRIVYCVDGGGYGPILIQTGRYLGMDLDRSIEPLLVVAIEYPDSASMPRLLLRNRDLVTPGTSIPEWVQQALGGSGPEPASDQFLSFIEEELDPLIRKRYDHSDAGAALVGDSYGGLFALYAFFRQSKTFDHYLMGSPGAVTENDPVFDVEAGQFEKGVKLKGRVYMAIGEHEGPNSGTSYELLGKNYYKLVELLRKRAYPDLQWTAEIIPGETHASVIPFSLSRGIRWLFGKEGDPALAPVPTL